MLVYSSCLPIYFAPPPAAPACYASPILYASSSFSTAPFFHPTTNVDSWTDKKRRKPTYKALAV